MPEAENILEFSKKDGIEQIIITNVIDDINEVIVPIMRFISINDPMEIEFAADGYSFEKVEKDSPIIMLDDNEELKRCIEIKLKPTDYSFKYTTMTFSNKVGFWQYDFHPDAKIVIQNEKLYILNPPSPPNW